MSKEVRIEWRATVVIFLMSTNPYVQAFRLVNTMCLTCHSQSQSSRALEMIVQAYWVDCYEARIVAIQLEQPLLSVTEARMTVLREACAVLRLTEKELRNRLYVNYTTPDSLQSVHADV